MSRTNKLFFAVSKGVTATERAEIKRFIGVGAVNILAVNPTKDELEKIYGTTLQNDPVYVTPKSADKPYEQVRIDFIIKVNDKDAVDADGNPIEAITKIAFFVNNAARKNKDNTKVQIIDKYGRTGWATQEEFKAKAIPVTSMGKQITIDKDYRAAYFGEEELTKFMKTFLNIPSVQKYNANTGEWHDVPDSEKPSCEIRFDHIKDWFKGDVKEIREAVSFQPTNTIKLLFGIRTTEKDGKTVQYQDVFTREFVYGFQKNYTRLEKQVNMAKQNGAYPNTEFLVCPMIEYKPQATQFKENAATAPVSDDPFASPAVSDDTPFATADDDLPFEMN